MEKCPNYFLHSYIASLQHFKRFVVWKKRLTGHFLELVSEALHPFGACVFDVFKSKNLGYLPKSHNQTVLKSLGVGHNAYEACVQSLYTQNSMDEWIDISLKVKHKKE